MVKITKDSEDIKLKTNSVEKRKSRAISEETKLKISNTLKGHVISEETRLKISKTLSGRKRGPHSKERCENISKAKKGKPLTEAHKKALSIHHADMSGNKHPMWKGGNKLRQARANAKHRAKGCVFITKNNPYDEPVEYHHIHPDLPFVVPCPTRIHKMFHGSTPYHHDNVNAMLGIKINADECKIFL